MVDLHIIYNVREQIPEELQENLMCSLDDYLELGSQVVDNWIKMYLLIFYNTIQEVNSELWRFTEQEILEELEM